MSPVVPDTKTIGASKAKVAISMQEHPGQQRSRGLLYRLQSQSPDRPIDPHRSIAAHVLALLNARGLSLASGISVPALTLDEIVHRAPQGLDALARRIKTLIGAYEPRLRQVHVKCQTPSAEPLIWVQVYGWSDFPHRTPFAIDFELSPDGQFYLR